MTTDKNTNPKASARQKERTEIKPSGTVKQGRRPMFKPFEKAPCFPTRYDANGNLRTIPAEKPTAQRWQFQIDDLCDERNRYKAHAEALAEALRAVTQRLSDNGRVEADDDAADLAWQALSNWEGAQGIIPDLPSQSEWMDMDDDERAQAGLY